LLLAPTERECARIFVVGQASGCGWSKNHKAVHPPTESVSDGLRREWDLQKTGKKFLHRFLGDYLPPY